MGRGLVCSRAVAKIQCQRRFCSRSFLSCEDVVGGKDVGSLPRLQG